MNADHIEHIRHLALPAILDARGEWCFIKNPKAATHTIESCGLEGRRVVWRLGWRNWKAVWEQMFVPRMDDVAVFTFVRNPWDRVLSAFSFCQQLRRKGEAYNKINRRLTFHDWMVDVLRVQGPSVNQHFAEQADSFMCNGVRIPEILIGRYERLDEDWGELADRVGLPNTLPERLNASRHEHYTTYYDPETRDIVSRLYRAEIDALGYEYGE